MRNGGIQGLCVLRTFGGVDFSLTFICGQSVSEFLWDRLPASIQFPVMPKRAQYARFSGELTSAGMQNVSRRHFGQESASCTRGTAVDRATCVVL